MDKNKNAFLEDNFDLDNFQGKYNKKYGIAETKQEKRAISIIVILIFVFGAIIIYQCILLGQYYYETWHNKNISNESLAVLNDVLTFGRYSGSENEGEKQVFPLIKELRNYFHNDDIAGYLMIDDTQIYTVVVQSQSHLNRNELYKSKDLYKNNSFSGSVFLDYKNSWELTDYNNVIYGKNMANGNLFGELRNFTNSEFLEEHKYIKYITPYEATKWEIFSAYGTDSDTNLIETEVYGIDEFYGIMLNMKARSSVETEVVIEKGDLILTLSTYGEETDSARYVVHARLLEREGVN